MDASEFLEEYDKTLEFSIVDGGSIKANYGDIIDLMDKYAKAFYEKSLKDKK